MADGLRDLVIVGGGLAGASLGFAMARAGARVTILEKETRFRDRVRGEGFFPWGCVEAKALGILDALRDGCGLDINGWRRYADGVQTADRDFATTTPSRMAMVNFRHEAMQECLITLAAGAGAELRRGVEVAGVTPGPVPAVMVRGGGVLRARMVVGADGRASRLRQWGGFATRQDPPWLSISSTVHEGLGATEDAIHSALDIARGQSMLLYPLGGGHHRTYLVYRSADRSRGFSGAGDARAFLGACGAMHMPAGWFSHARQVGPLATFHGAPSWVAGPAKDGIVLIGDAAGTSDPSFGSGLSLALRDARVLRDHLVAEDDWALAAARYAHAHDCSFGALKRITDWFTELHFATGPGADARRARALPLRAADPSRMPDLQGLGPDAPSDEHAHARLFGLI